MKKLIIFSIIALASISLTAQPSQTDKLFVKYRGMDGVTSFYIPGFLCRFAASIADLDAEEEELLRTIRSIKILTVEHPGLNSELNFAREVRRERMDNRYQLLLEVHESDEDVLIYARERNQCITELAIVVGGDENTLVCIKGRMDHDLLYALSEVTGISECSFTREL